MSRYLPGISEHVPGGRASFRDGPRLAASQVKGHHQIPVIHELRQRDAPRAGAGHSGTGLGPADAVCTPGPIRACPESGRSNVVRIRTSVVLPAPFGAEQAQYPPGRGVQAHAGERTGRDRAGAWMTVRQDWDSRAVDSAFTCLIPRREGARTG